MRNAVEIYEYLKETINKAMEEIRPDMNALGSDVVRDEELCVITMISVKGPMELDSEGELAVPNLVWGAMTGNHYSIVKGLVGAMQSNEQMAELIKDAAKLHLIQKFKIKDVSDEE